MTERDTTPNIVLFRYFHHCKTSDLVELRYEVVCGRTRSGIDAGTNIKEIETVPYLTNIAAAYKISW